MVRQRTFTAADITVYGLLLSFGVFFIFMLRSSDDFFAGDVTYFELGRSLAESGFYGFDFKPETTHPPGFPAIVAGFCITAGCTYTGILRSMALFTTLALIASYELLRREQDRAVAAATALLLASSPMLFDKSTRWIGSDLPYFLTSMLTLLMATRLEIAKSHGARTILCILGGFLVASSLLIRSAGITLVAGSFAWLVVSFCFDRRIATRRSRVFFPILIVGIVVQGFWMGWASTHEFIEWPKIEGYPKSYIAQLRVKDGNNPESGTASAMDLLSRVARNVNDQAVALTKLLIRKDYVNSDWFSPMVVCPLLMILLGLVWSIGRSGGGLLEWYFVCYVMMCVLWPWYGDTRFLLVIVPLACLYIWRGGKVIADLASKKSRAVGFISFSASTLFAIYARTWGWRSGSAVFWELVIIVSAWIAWTGSCKPPRFVSSFLARWPGSLSVGGKSFTIMQVFGVVCIGGLVVMGLLEEIAMGRENLAFDIKSNYNYPDVLAGKWIQANTDSLAVVMARQQDVVYHYSRRKVIWFPPSSDPRLLMEGIRKYKVEFVIVSDRAKYSYWLPPESVGFQSLLRTYSGAFQLVHDEPQFTVFRVVLS